MNNMYLPRKLYRPESLAWKRVGVVTISLLLVLFSSMRFIHAAEPVAKPPNIVFIFADDLGFMDLNCYGRTEHKTPNIDRLAATGIRFDQCYCAQPICSPSRVALMTGKTPARLHLTNYLPGRADCNSQKLLQPIIEGQLALEETTIAEILKKNGYATGIFGKWHLGNAAFGPKEQGFDTAFLPPANSTPFGDFLNQDENFEGGKSEYAITRAAIEFIEQNKERPFFCYVPHNNPHIALNVNSSVVALNPGTFNPANAAMMQTLDDSVGKIVGTLERLGLTSNTLVVFTSDHGGLHVLESPDSPSTYNTPFRAGKGFVYEGGLKVPMIVSWPSKITKPQVCNTPVMLTDMMPTFMEVAGMDIAKTVGPLDGKSFKNRLLAYSDTPSDRELYWHFPNYTNQGGRPSGAVRIGDWKLIESYEDSSTELYQLKEDPSESNNLASSEPGRSKTMLDKLRSWRLSVGAQECRPNESFDKASHTRLYEDTDVSKLTPGKDYLATAEPLREWRKEMNQAIKSNKPIVTDPKNEIRLQASQARVHGEKLRYEPESYKNVLGYWTNPDDWADWTFLVTKPGEYEVEIHYGCGAGNGGSNVNFIVDGKSLPLLVRDTDHFQSIVAQSIGVMKLDKGEHTLEVRPQNKAKAAVMDIRRIVLRKQ